MIFSEYNFDTKRQRVSVKLGLLKHMKNKKYIILEIFLEIFKHRLRKCYNFVKNAFGIIFIE
jgi:hypothetical protein